ncbi:DUF4260 domain-containing protein [Novosphingobium sp.]|uniref:DUF4260 domain-containing protein n=1 Tax=Novosphingobium sp. TaxID=1874826 RepID=UPI003BAA037E
MELAANDVNEQAAAPAGLGAARGMVAGLLRLEGAVALALATIAFHRMGGSWWQFAYLFLLPDLSMLGYLANRRLGAWLYNAGHTYGLPALLALATLALANLHLLPIAAIWAAHIGFDRLMGYGLKYETAFGATHLGWRGL